MGNLRRVQCDPDDNPDADRAINDPICERNDPVPTWIGTVPALRTYGTWLTEGLANPLRKMTNMTHNSENMITHSALAMGALALGLLLLSTPANGQEAASTPPPASTGLGTGFGVKGGANWSTLYVEEARDVNARLGFSLGLFARIAPTGNLGFQIEVLYDQKGTTITKTVGVIDQETTYKFDYIDVPLLVVIPLGEVLELHAGGYAGAMILSERRTSGDQSNTNTDPGDGKFNAFDYGIIGGIGVNLGTVQIGARYNHGLNPVSDDAISGQVLGDSKNACAQLYLALALGKGD